MNQQDQERRTRDDAEYTEWLAKEEEQQREEDKGESARRKEAGSVFVALKNFSTAADA